MKELIYRLRIGLPKDNYRTFTARIKWFLFGVSGSVYEFGSCGGRVARKDKRDGSVAFVLWEAGEQGHKVDYWHNFDSSWWDGFKHITANGWWYGLIFNRLNIEK